ncbi:MAG: ABC transporter permease [Gemmatimonadales bacterium]
MGAFLADLKYGLRMVIKHPGLAGISILALALGIGLTTMMWSIVYGALLRGLPVPEGDRVVAVYRTNPSQNVDRTSVIIQDFDEWRSAQKSFEDLAGYYQGTVNLSGSTGRPERYQGAFITPNAVRLLRVSPILGRWFHDDEGSISGPNAVVLGYDAWRTRFASDSGVIGRTIRANDVSVQVVGVMPPGFKFPSAEEVWLPLRIDRLKSPRDNSQQVEVFGRLKPGVSAAQAARELQPVEDRLAAEYPKTNQGYRAAVLSYTDYDIGPEPHTLLWTMMGAVLGVLLIACSNVANLLLARAAARTKEVAVRTALGASRWRIVSQLISESLVLSFCGALAGLGIAVYGVRLFNDAITNATTIPYYIVMKVDFPVLLFVTAITFVAGVIAGVLPALQATGAKISDVLKDESRGSSSMRLGRFSKGLVVAEIALAGGLLIASGFMIQSVVQRSRFDYGVPTRSIFTARIGLFEATYPDSTSRQVFWNSLVQRLEGLPSQHGVALTSNLPGPGTGTRRFAIEGVTYAADRDRPRARFAAVSPGFFGAFALHALEGRVLGPGDIGGAAQVAVVTKNFASRYFPGTSPLGRRVRFGNSDSPAPWLTIVGVLPNVWYQGTDDNTPETILTPIAQADYRFLSVAVATDGGDPLRFADPVRAAVAAVNPDLPIYFVRTLQRFIDDNGWFYRVFGVLFMAFGFAALLLAAIGVYGVMSFSVARRTQEVGVRMALGAGGRQVLRMFLRQGAVQVGAGLVIALGLAILLSKGLKIVLFQVNTSNPLMFAGVMGALALTGLVATLIPARRAARVHPMEALRYE